MQFFLGEWKCTGWWKQTKYKQETRRTRTTRASIRYSDYRILSTNLSPTGYDGVEMESRVKHSRVSKEMIIDLPDTWLI